MHEKLVDHINSFVELTAEESDLLSNYFKPKYLKKKQCLLKEGEVSRHECFVISGATKTFTINASGEEHILHFSIEDWWVGDLYSFWTGLPTVYTITALEACNLLVIDSERMEELYLKVPKMERYFRILLKKAYIASQSRVMGNMAQTAEERYLEFRKRYANLEQRIPQFMIASYLGITPEFLSKIRRKLARG